MPRDADPAPAIPNVIASVHPKRLQGKQETAFRHTIKRLRVWTGIQIEARQRHANHSALMTGERHALERKLPAAAAVDTAVSYAERIGAPDAIVALGASRETLAAIARAKMQEVSGAKGT